MRGMNGNVYLTYWNKRNNAPKSPVSNNGIDDHHCCIEDLAKSIGRLLIKKVNTQNFQPAAATASTLH